MIKQDFNQHLLAYTPLTDLVDDDIYPIVGGAGQAMPAVMYSFDSEHETDLQGDTVLERYQVQLNAVAKDYAEANGIACQVIQALKLNNNLLNNNPVQLCRFDSENESFDTELDAYIVTTTYTLIP